MKAALLYILGFIVPVLSISQEIDINPFIKAWKADDLSQSKKAAVFYDRLDREKDTARYHTTLSALYNYLDKHYDKRIEARKLMY